MKTTTSASIRDLMSAIARIENRADLTAAQRDALIAPLESKLRAARAEQEHAARDTANLCRAMRGG